MNKDKVAAVEALYARLPRLVCKGLCEHSCGPIGLTELEAKRIEKKLHRLPTLREGEARCSLLAGGRCEAYALRPLICRLYGVAETMRCPHGCAPARYLTKEETTALVQQIQRISPLTQASLALLNLARKLDI